MLCADHAYAGCILLFFAVFLFILFGLSQVAWYRKTHVIWRAHFLSISLAMSLIRSTCWYSSSPDIALTCLYYHEIFSCNATNSFRFYYTLPYIFITILSIKFTRPRIHFTLLYGEPLTALCKHTHTHTRSLAGIQQYGKCTIIERQRLNDILSRVIITVLDKLLVQINNSISVDSICLRTIFQ